MRRLTGLALLMMSVSFPLHADIDESAYEAVGAVRSDEERRRMLANFARDIDAERQREAEEAAERERERAEALAREAARPYPERLTAQRCTLCHSPENYTSKHHTWLYWRLVVARMVWLNAAFIAPEEQTVIAGHLAAAYPARGEEIVSEYGLPILGLALLSGMVQVARRFRKGKA